MSEAKEAALREALNSPMTGDERLRLSLILAEGGGEWEPDPDDAEATLDALDASRAREKALVEALRPLLPLLRLLTIRQVMQAGDDAIEAVGLNPYCIKEGLATGDEPIPLWKFEALVQPYSTPSPSPDMPSDCHPQGE